MLSDVRRVFIPVFWFSQKVKIPDRFAFMLYIFLHLQTIFVICGLFLIVNGFIIILYLVYKTMLHKRFVQTYKDNLENETTLTLLTNKMMLPIIKK